MTTRRPFPISTHRYRGFFWLTFVYLKKKKGNRWLKGSVFYAVLKGNAISLLGPSLQLSKRFFPTTILFRILWGLKMSYHTNLTPHPLPCVCVCVCTVRLFSILNKWLINSLTSFVFYRNCGEAAGIPSSYQLNDSRYVFVKVGMPLSSTSFKNKSN